MELAGTDVAAKFERAYELIEELVVEVHKYKTNPPPYDIERRDEPIESTTYVVLKSLTPPGIDISVRIGEIVHHARSALDHVISAAARDRGLSDAKRAFPIVIFDKSGERRRCRQLLSDLSTSMGEAIWRLQPFQSPNIKPESVSLAVLHALWNTDKHRNLAVTTSAAEMSQVFVASSDGSTVLGGQFRVERLEVGGVLAAFPMADGPLPPDTRLTATLAISVHLEDVPEAWQRLSTVEALHRLVDTAHHVAQTVAASA